MTTPETEIAWAAGFFDGEGTTSHRPKHSTRIQISQKEPGLLHRFADAVGSGSVRGPYRNGTGHVWQYRVSNRRDVAAVIALLWPYLGEIKKAQADAALVAPTNVRG
jgi:hypothetical protein